MWSVKLFLLFRLTFGRGFEERKVRFEHFMEVTQPSNMILSYQYGMIDCSQKNWSYLKNFKQKYKKVTRPRQVSIFADGSLRVDGNMFVLFPNKIKNSAKLFLLQYIK